jgi:MinD-like ATPase involved in chromosome partitioning or flagellar assembly
MAIVTVAGDACTTTAVALAAAWPLSSDSFLIEADPEGGDLAAWLDLPATPSLSTVVTRVLDGSWPEIERHTRLAASGLRVLPAPARAVEAQQAVTESARSLVPALAAMRNPVAIVDAGRAPTSPHAHPFIAAAAVIVLVHRQATQSPPAAAVRLQRLADQLEALAGGSASVVLAVVGGQPFDLPEIERFVAESAGATAVVALPVDALAAATLGGRTGVSARRLARLPLTRAAAQLAGVVHQVLDPATDVLWRSGR